MDFQKKLKDVYVMQEISNVQLINWHLNLVILRGVLSVDPVEAQSSNGVHTKCHQVPCNCRHLFNKFQIYFINTGHVPISLCRPQKTWRPDVYNSQSTQSETDRHTNINM